jgi:hypothetical protein
MGSLFRKSASVNQGGYVGFRETDCPLAPGQRHLAKRTGMSKLVNEAKRAAESGSRFPTL